MNERSKNPRVHSYPQNVDEWRETIGKALNLTAREGKTRFQAGTFPFADLIGWIHREFGSDKGYRLDFIPALMRNRNGLIAWVYGNGSEPYWLGHGESKC